MASDLIRPVLRRTARTAVALSVASVAAVAVAGCADAFTYSRTETATARVLQQEGDHQAAAAIYANQVRRNPHDYEAHYNLGLTQYDMGRANEAIRSFKTGLEVMPLTPSGRDDEEYRFYLIDALSTALAENDPDASQLAQIEKVSKGNKTLKLLVAMTHGKAGRPDNALITFREAQMLDRSDPQIAKQYGLYLESIRQEEEAVDMLRLAYRLNTQDEEVAAALRRMGQIPGPAILSRTELTKPGIPLGPIPEWKSDEEAAKAEKSPQANAAQPQVAPQAAPQVTPQAAPQVVSPVAAPSPTQNPSLN